jgi:hypothetical protein
MKKQKEPRAFDDVLDLIEKADKAQRGLVCEGDAVERRATDFYCAKLRATKRILSACGRAILSVNVAMDESYIKFDSAKEIAKAILAYRMFLARWERADRRRTAFEMSDSIPEHALGRFPCAVIPIKKERTRPYFTRGSKKPGSK